MLLYFDYDGKFRSLINHGYPPRQGADLSVKVCLPIDFWQANGMDETDFNKTIQFSKEGVGLSSPLLLSEGEEFTFVKDYENEITYNFVDGEKYLAYSITVQPDGYTTQLPGELGLIVTFTKPESTQDVYTVATGYFTEGVKYYTKEIIEGETYYSWAVINANMYGKVIPANKYYTRETIESEERITVVNGVANLFVERTYGEIDVQISKDLIARYATIMTEIHKISVRVNKVVADVGEKIQYVKLEYENGNLKLDDTDLTWQEVRDLVSDKTKYVYIKYGTALYVVTHDNGGSLIVFTNIANEGEIIFSTIRVTPSMPIAEYSGPISLATNIKNGNAAQSLVQAQDSVNNFSVDYSTAENVKFGQGSYTMSTILPAVSGQYTYSDTNKLSVVREAFGVDSFAAGGQSIATGKRAFATGTAVMAIGNYSMAEGNATIAIGLGSHTEGQQTIAMGPRAHAEGSMTIAEGEISHAEGQSTWSKGFGSHTEGFKTKATANYTHAEGTNTEASGSNAHSEGLDTIASGNNSHAEGEYTDTNDFYSAHTEGFHTKAGKNYQTVVGAYNEVSDEAMFVVGNGNVSERSNAMEVMYDGRVKVYGEPTEGTDIVRKQELDKKLTQFTNITERNQAYIKTVAGVTTLLDISDSAVPNSIVKRDADNTFRIGRATTDWCPVPKKEMVEYVDEKIEEIKNNPDVVDIVQSYADLMAYNTSTLGDKDIIRVLTDETRYNVSTYYRWNRADEQWIYIGSSEGGGVDVSVSNFIQIVEKDEQPTSELKPGGLVFENIY